MYCKLTTFLIGVMTGFVGGSLDGRCNVVKLSTAFIYYYSLGSCL